MNNENMILVQIYVQKEIDGTPQKSGKPIRVTHAQFVRFQKKLPDCFHHGYLEVVDDDHSKYPTLTGSLKLGEYKNAR